MKRLLPLLAVLATIAVVAAPRPLAPANPLGTPLAAGASTAGLERATGAPRSQPSNHHQVPDICPGCSGHDLDGMTGAPPCPAGFHPAACRTVTAYPAPTAVTVPPATATNPRPPTANLAPTSDGLAGVATWFDGYPGTAAAGPALRRWLGPDWRGTRLAVSAPGCGCPPVIVVLSDFCRCDPPNGHERLIDLDDQSFAALAPLSRGVLKVIVRVVP